MYNDAILFASSFILLVHIWRAFVSQRFTNILVTSDVSRESMINAAKHELKRINLSSDSASLIDLRALYNFTERLVATAQVVQYMSHRCVTSYGKVTLAVTSIFTYIALYVPVTYIVFLLFRCFMMIYGNTVYRKFMVTLV
jgi:hypothetical protein